MVADPLRNVSATGTSRRHWPPQTDVRIVPDGTAVIADGGDQPDAPPDRSAVVQVRRDGTVVRRFGRWGNYDGQFEIAHCAAVAKDGAVYVGDITGGRVQKFVRDGS